MKVVQCHDVSKRYGEKLALNQMNFSIKKDTITGLIGRNGAGKTTLLKLICGFTKISSGQIEVFSEDPFNNLKISQNTIFIDDQMVMPQSLNLEEIIEEVSHFYPNWDMELAKKLFEYFSFHRKERHQHLSKGKKSTFNMIIGLSARCPLTIFDEPTTGMDAAVRKDFYRALLKDYLNFPRTIILSSHLLSEIEEIMEDVLLIKNGKKYLHLSVEDLKEYAIGLSGKTDAVHRATRDKEIFYTNAIGKDTTYSVIKADFSDKQIEDFQRQGIEISSVSPEDVCVYVTNETRGGIDDVFNRN